MATIEELNAKYGKPTGAAPSAPSGRSRRDDFTSALESRRQERETQRITDVETGSAERAGALFPAKTGEGPLAAGLKATGNIPSSIFGLGKSLTKALANPIDTFRGIKDIVEGGIEKAGTATGVKLGLREAPEEESEDVQLFNAVVDQLKEDYGSLEALQRTATNDPFAFGADVMGILAGGAGVARKVPKLAKTVEKVEDIAAIPGKFAKKTVSAGAEKSMDILRGVVDKKVTGDIQTSISDLLGSTKPLSRRTKELSSRNVDINKELSDLNVYRGLKVEKGSIVPDEAISTIQNRIDNAMDMKREFLPKIDEFAQEITKAEYRTSAIESLKTQRLSPADELDMIKKIDGQLDALPDSMKPSFLDDLRARFRKSSRDAKGQLKSSNEFAALENSARDLVFKASDDLPFDTDGQLASLNDYIKGQIETKTFLDKNLRGQKVKGGRLGTRTGQIIGAVAGAKGGILGSVLGAELGGTIASILTNNQLGSSIKMKMIRNLTDNQQVLDEVAKLLDIAEDYTAPQLGAPAPGAFRTEVTGGAPIDIPKKLPSAVEASEKAAREAGDITIR